MKNSKSFKDLSLLQKIGYVCIIIAGIFILLKMGNILPYDYYTTHDLPNYLFIAGAVLVVCPTLLKKRSKKMTVIAMLFFSSIALYGQDYSKQIDAFAKSFADKNTTAISPHMSKALQFGTIPAANTPAIMKNIVTNLPTLNSMAILESEHGKAKIAYDFEALGKSESFIHFDKEGKISKIELVENLINQEAEARRQQKVPLPTPGELGNKYIPKKVEFTAPDGLIINANLYDIGKGNPVVLLMHQAGYNRFEYADIAPVLNKMGYNCLAVDLRSGGDFAGKPNITYQRATKKGEQPTMIDAQQDISAAVDYLKKTYGQKVIVWGSSFSSSLALLEGVNNKDIKAVIGFSPGDYFGDKAPSLKTVFSTIDKPYFVTSSKQEAITLSNLIEGTTPTSNQQQFIPESNGFHGSRALWTGQEGAQEYWSAIKRFLTTIK